MAAGDNLKQQIYGNPNWIDGRINRAEYFWRTLLTGFTMGFAALGTVMFLTVPPISIPLGVFAFWMYWRIEMACVKRLHDLGWSGWWSLLIVAKSFNFTNNIAISFSISLIAIILSLVLLFCKGNAGENKYGKDPLMDHKDNP